VGKREQNELASDNRVMTRNILLELISGVFPFLKLSYRLNSSNPSCSQH
jgi:hypothetical protein